MSTPDKLLLVGPGGQEVEFQLAKATILLGRDETNDIVLPTPDASRTHARLESGPSGLTLIDLDSKNGTYVNGVAVRKVSLNPGDVVTMGGFTLRLPRRSVSRAEDQELPAVDSKSHPCLPIAVTETAVARVTVHTKTKTWEVGLLQECVTIGREPGLEIALDDEEASRRHARIERHGDRFVLRDLKSTNGSWVNNCRVDQHGLSAGDTIRIGRTRLIFKPAFGANDLTEVTRVASPRSTRRPVVVVPGIMGSELWQGSERLWPNAAFLLREPEILKYSTDTQAKAGGLVQELVIVPNLVKLEQYGRLGNYLEEALGYRRGRDLLEFAYDWRQDIRLSARALATSIERWRVPPPVTIIAHSLGCLVARYYVERLDGKKTVDRLILLGGPHNGSPKVVAHLLTGPDLLPFGMMSARLRKVVATFPSMYQGLPTYACVADQKGRRIKVLADDSWVSGEHRPLLRMARQFRRELGSRSSVPTICIFGYGLKTVTGTTVRRDSTGRWALTGLTTKDNGDTLIPERSSVVAGAEIHPVKQYHGSLYVDSDVKMRLKLELTRRAYGGETSA